MAAKSQRAHDSCVVERRLRPIYDWLDVGNNKKALQEIEKVLKKSPTLQCARALKSLAILRLGKEQEALTILDTLAKELPFDNATLLVMTISYRESQQLEMVCQVYEVAVKKDPTNEELHTYLFMSYVRVAHFEKQQHAAMALYRLMPKNPYYFWAIMSIVLQATRGVGCKEPTKKSVLLTLAQRMIDKFIAENKLEAEQEVQLYIMILQLQNKHSEALEFLEGPLGSKLMPGAMPQAGIPFLVKLEKWERLNLLSKELIWDNPDRWDFYTSYFQSAFLLMKKSTENCADGPGSNCKNDVAKSGNIRSSCLDTVDDSSEKCYEFLCQIIENVAESGKLLRGPYLARLELYKRLGENDKGPQGLMGNAADLLVEYFRKFGHKACSVSDLRPYLTLVKEDKLEELAQQFIDTIGVSQPVIENDDEMQRHICSLQMSRACGRQAKLTGDHARALASALALRCRHATINITPSSTERTIADPYCLLVAHICYDLAVKTCSSKPLVEALCLLEYALEKSPSNFHCKLLCLKFYHLLGCGWGAQTIYETLDVKHVQLDSLGHVHCNPLALTALHQLTKDAYDSTLAFFTNTYRDSVDHLTFSYKFGSFMKLEELMEFRERLYASLHRAATGVESALLNVVMAPTHSVATKAVAEAPCTPDDDRIRWDLLRDNRDLAVYTHWDPVYMDNKEAPAKQFDQDKTFLRIKVLILRCLVTCVDISSSADRTDSAHRTQRIDTLESLIEEFSNLVRNIQDNELKAADVASPTGQLPSRLLGFTNSPLPFREIYSASFRIVVLYMKNETENLQLAVEEAARRLEECFKATERCIQKQTESEDPLWTCKETLETAVNYLEMISIVCVCIGVCCEASRMAKVRRKKKNETPTPSAPNPPSSILRQISSQAESLTKTLETWIAPPDTHNLEVLLSGLTVGDNIADRVPKKLREGHDRSLGSLKFLLKEKSRYAASLGA